MAFPGGVRARRVASWRGSASASAAAGRLDASVRPALDGQQEPDDRRQHLQRRPPPRPRGTRGGAQAPGHVHRVDRHPRPDALPLGDHRQRRRRGAGRRRPQRSRSPCTPTARSRSTTTAAASPPTRSPRPGCPASRWWPPSCTPAASSAAARTSPPAACTASASRWSTRCPRGWTSTSTGRPPSRASASAAASPASSTATARTAAFTPEQSGLTRKGKRVAKGSTGTRIRFWPDRQIFTKDADVRVRGPARPGPADVVHRARPRAGDPRPARRPPGRGEVPPRRRHRASSPSSWPTTSRSPTCSGSRAPTRSPRPCRCSTTRAT